jgi:uncharacterized Zn-binding protein involved in type VI secretion
MPGNARLSDVWVGICLCHPPIPVIGMSGVIVTASPNVNVNSLGQARMTDVVIGYCGHPGSIVSASGDTITNNLGTARVGDAVAGCVIGTIVTGSGNTITNG